PSAHASRHPICSSCSRLSEKKILHQKASSHLDLLTLQACRESYHQERARQALGQNPLPLGAFLLLPQLRLSLSWRCAVPAPRKCALSLGEFSCSWHQPRRLRERPRMFDYKATDRCR